MKILISVILFFQLNNAFSQGAKTQTANPYKKLVIAAWKLSSRVSPNPIKLNYVFDKSFFKLVSEEDTVNILKKLHSQNGNVVNVTSVTYHSQFSGDFFFQTDNGYTIPVSITVNEQGKITGLFFRPSFKKEVLLEDAIKNFEELPYKKGLLIKKFDSLEDLSYSLNEKEIFPIASAFKLYILAYILENNIKWDKVINIKNDYKSLPSGKMHLYPDGSPVTLFSLAMAMISESDNTATDALIETLGRENIEEFMKSYNSKPELNIPLLKTSEMFKLKSSTQIAADYINSSIKEKRKILKDLTKIKLEMDSVNFSKPYKTDSIEWFASPEDICQLMNYFRIKNNEYANAILSMNPGIDTRTAGYLFAGYKGGSEPGVINMNWLLKSKNGNFYCVSSSAMSPDETIDEKKYISIMQEILNKVP